MSPPSGAERTAVGSKAEIRIRYRRQDVHTFLVSRSDEYDLRSVEKWRFLSMITEGWVSR